MKRSISKFNFLKKFSLVKQLTIVLSFGALLIVTVMMPLIDYNLNSIIDQQMYETLTLSQYPAGNQASMTTPQSSQTYQIIYNSSKDTIERSNVPTEEVLIELYLNLFGSDLKKLLQSSESTIRNKGSYGNETFYYLITQYENEPSYYLISIVNSDYSSDLIMSLRNQIIYIQYGFFVIFAGLMILWVLSLINPLKKIKNYIDNIKERKEDSLFIDRSDEIGIVSQALVDMNEDLGRQERIKEEMIHNISHDLKTPIALIQTYGQSIKDDIFPYGDRNSSMDIILENAQRLEHKVRSLLYLNRLDFLQSENQELNAFDMKQLIQKIVSQMDALKPSVVLITELDDVCFVGDEEHWRVAIENIIDNATIYAKHEIHIILKDKFLEIYNDGEQIEEDILPFLFQPYVKGVKGRFGLGLSIVYKVAQMFGYHVYAKNQDVGVSFIFEKEASEVL